MRGWASFSPPTSPWPPRSAREADGWPRPGCWSPPPCPSTSTPVMSGSPLNWQPASAGTALATHRPLPWPMNQVAEPMPPLWTAMLTSSSFQYCRKLDLSTRSVSTKGVKQQSGYPPSSHRASRARDIRGIGQAQRLNASEISQVTARNRMTEVPICKTVGSSWSGQLFCRVGRQGRTTIRAGPARRIDKDPEATGQDAHRLTDLLTRPVGTGETMRDTGDAQPGLRLVSETRRDAGDGGDVRRMAHNPEVEGSNPSPATKARGPFSNRERAFCLWFVN